MFAQAVQPAAGFTLIELAVVCALVGVLTAVALPSHQSHLLRSGRADAVDALTRLQLAQAQYHAAHGLYATELSVLRGVPQSASTQGLYTLAVAGGGDGYRATALAQGRQRKDSACPLHEGGVRGPHRQHLQRGRLKHQPDRHPGLCCRQGGPDQPDPPTRARVG